ncbi:MAG: septation ring formation regulator EzrA [Sporolactobacillus sp.]
MLYVVIGFILLIVIGIVYGAWMRRHAYGEIDRAEERRMAIVNRPVAQELAKIKQLKMVGETEKNFETWRTAWDKIIASELPSIEDALFSSEELVDKYRFKKASEKIKELSGKMDGIEAQIDTIISELNKVVDSESQNRADVQPVKEAYHNAKKTMLTKRLQFGRALPVLEKSMAEIDEMYQKFGAATDEGRYVEARDHLIAVKHALEELMAQTEQIPVLYEEINHIIPEQIKDLKRNKEDMNAQGYMLENLQIDMQIAEAEQQLQTIAESVARMELKDASEAIKTIHEQFDWLLAQMEKEVLSRRQLSSIAPDIGQKVARVGERIRQLMEESETVKKNYRLGVADLKNEMAISKAFERAEKGYLSADAALENAGGSYTDLLGNMQKIDGEMDTIEEAAADFSRKIDALRKDELAARETIEKLKHTLFETRRLVQRSNLPGVPESFNEALRQGGGFLRTVDEKLDQSPLNINEVNAALGDAQHAINSVLDRAEKLVETAKFAEEMIRYGNRYRSEDAEIAGELHRAEELFRKFDYEASARTAVEAVERKEPKILKRTDLYETKPHA